MKLDNSWYSEQPYTTFHTFEHRKERKGFKHEFIVLILLDGSMCRVERMGDPDARFDAISPRGSIAHDMAQCFGPDELEQACLDTSDIISTTTLPFDCDLMDVLRICRAIYEGEKTRNYTLQVYNCYFFSLAIQACLTRPVAQWENEALFKLWLSQVDESVTRLPHALQLQAESHSSSLRIILRVCSALSPNPGCTDLAKVMEEMKHGIQIQLKSTGDSRSIYQEISNRINDSLWHSTVGSGLHQLIGNIIKEVISEIIKNSIGRLSVMPDTRTHNLNTNTPASGATSPNTGNSSKRYFFISKRLRAKPLEADVRSMANISVLDFKGNPARQEEREDNLADWCQWIVKDLPYLILWLLHITLGLWGITIFALETNPVPLDAAEDQLERALARLECLERPTCSDLEQFINELHSVMNNKAAVWYINPWADIRDCITRHIGFDMITESEKLGATIRSCLKGQHEAKDLSVSAFQRHITGRIKLQAEEVQSAWLGSAATIETELERMLSEVWKMIREDDGFDITKRKEQELQSGGTYPVVTGSMVEQQKAQEQTTGTTSYSTMGVSSRKYVDLIFQASGKYGSWDPANIIEVGDWGKIDRETGEFIKEGNMFRDPECCALLPEVADAPLVKTTSPEDVLRITAGAQMELKNDLYTEVGAMGELGVRVSTSWEFTPRNRAAVLIATDAYSKYFEVGVVFPRLRKLKKLEGKVIVTEAVHCPAYALLLTEKGKGGKASLSLHTGLSDVKAAVGVGAGAGWKFTTESGFWRTACGYRANLEGKDAVYTPLYRLKKVTRSWRMLYR